MAPLAARQVPEPIEQVTRVLLAHRSLRVAHDGAVHFCNMNWDRSNWRCRRPGHASRCRDRCFLRYRHLSAEDVLTRLCLDRDEPLRIRLQPALIKFDLDVAVGSHALNLEANQVVAWIVRLLVSRGINCARAEPDVVRLQDRALLVLVTEQVEHSSRCQCLVYIFAVGQPVNGVVDEHEIGGVRSGISTVCMGLR